MEKKYSGVLHKTHFPAVLKQTMNELNASIEQNLMSGFEASAIYPLDPNKVIKRLPSSTSDTNNVSWLNQFENIWSEHRMSHNINQVKRRRLDVAPGKSISTFEDPDDPVPIQPNTPVDPIVIPIPSSSSAPAYITEVQKISTINIESDEKDHFTDSLKIGEFILVKWMYNERTPKETYKMFPCLIKAIGKSIKGIVFFFLFMRPYKGSNTTFIFPTIEDVENVYVDDIVLRLKKTEKQRGRISFDL